MVVSVKGNSYSLSAFPKDLKKMMDLARKIVSSSTVIPSFLDADRSKSFC